MGFDEFFKVVKPWETKTKSSTIGVVGMPGTDAHALNKTLRNFKSSMLKKFNVMEIYGPVLATSDTEHTVVSQILHKSGLTMSDVADKKDLLNQIMNNSGLVISPIDILKQYRIAKFKT